MQVYIVRHANAGPPRGGGGDASRTLSAGGEAEAQVVGRGLHGLGVALDRLFTSPRLRARQTARILAAHLGDLAVEPLPELEMGGRPEAILDVLAGQGDQLAVVGHMPTLGELVALAAHGVGGREVSLPTAAVARVDWSAAPRPGAGELRWLRTPRDFAPLA